MRKQKAKPQIRHKLTTVSLYIATFVAVIIFWRQSMLLLIILAVISLLLNIVTGWRYIWTYLMCAVLGSLSEVVCIWAGAWHYGDSQFWGIPIWLPLVWGNASILFYELAKTYARK